MRHWKAFGLHGSAAALLLVGTALAATSTDYSLPTCVLDGGGVSAASAGYATVNASAQPGEVGTAASAAYAAQYGFIPMALVDAAAPQGDWSLIIGVYGNGMTDPEPGTYEYSHGDAVNVSAYAGLDALFSHWDGDLGAADPFSPSIQLSMVRNYSVTAVFRGVGEGEGEGMSAIVHTADQNHDHTIDLSELLRLIQFFNSGQYSCQEGTEDGYAPGPGEVNCTHHDSDYDPDDWSIGLSELLRLIQFFNSTGYHACPEGDDGFCPGFE